MSGIPLPTSLPLPSALVIVFIGLGIAFLGRKVIKILVFLGAGLFGGSMVFSFLDGRFGGYIPLIGGIAGFLVLGFLSLNLLKFLFGIMTGLAGYYILVAITGNQVLGILGAIIIFVIGLFLFKYYLSVGTAFGGAMLVMSGLQAIGLYSTLSALVAVVVGILGAYVQIKQLWK